ncbi:uncharacterized protein LAJ45_04907 [Morchella importuna]|uniref:uncharacterized protein n=1 Tax=Morchella importuna TaxID=1174673 RepID=UPI001E8E45C1|nr:uncharacterized protein LAJ45_04907 [Morchella importuna]KAH8151205.1 hypothetical protein LAJ45_04907 [Morchella importuna]
MTACNILCHLHLSRSIIPRNKKVAFPSCASLKGLFPTQHPRIPLCDSDLSPPPTTNAPEFTLHYHLELPVSKTYNNTNIEQEVIIH